jgi:hypothetical protein
MQSVVEQRCSIILSSSLRLRDISEIIIGYSCIYSGYCFGFYSPYIVILNNVYVRCGQLQVMIVYMNSI